VYGEEPSASADRDPGGKPPRAGGDGRWAAWPKRVGLWSAILFDETPPSGSGTGNDTTGTTASGFPVTLGEAFVMRFEQIYLNYGPSTAARWAQQLAAFIPANARAQDPQFGWNGHGTSVTQSTEVAGIDVRSADTAVVTLLTSANGQPVELGVPRYLSDGRPVVPGQPAWLPAPPAAALASARQAGCGQTAKGALASQLPGFCQAFAVGGQAALGRYLASGASIGGLGGAVSPDSVTPLQLPRGGATRDIAVTTDLTIPDQVGTGSPRLVTTCDMSVIDQQSGKWYVKDVRASTQPMGTHDQVRVTVGRTSRSAVPSQAH
jgi:hypothetical protein